MSAGPLALVVEDSDDQTDLLRLHLERAGFDVIAAPSAERALEICHEVRPALAIVDLILPGISGQELAGVLRESFPECLLVISSVLHYSTYPEADAILPKPISGARLRSIAKRVAR